jgi:hypothetical protein
MLIQSETIYNHEFIQYVFLKQDYCRILVQPEYFQNEEIWIFAFDFFEENNKIIICLCQNGEPIEIIYRDNNYTDLCLTLLQELSFFYQPNNWKKIFHPNVPRVLLTDSKYFHNIKSIFEKIN